MKLITATLATAALLALAGTVPAAHAQDQQQQDKQHPPKQDQKPTHPQQEQKPAHPQEQQKPAHPQQPRQQEQRPQERQQQPRQQQEQQKQQQKTEQHQQQQAQKQRETQQKQEQKAQHQQQEQQRNASHPQPARTQRAQQNAPERGGHARGNPQQTAHYEQAHMRRYSPRANEHVVRIPDNDFQARFGEGHRFHMGRPVVVDGFPRFQYSGFWFVLEEPWPNYWYDSDDFYVTYDGGLYWLCDYNDPGVQVQLVVVTL